MIPSGRNAWKDNQEVRWWYEVILDTSAEPPNHTAYQCKCCWEQFPAETNLLTLLGHATGHERRGDQPYSARRPSAITGEQVVELHNSLVESFSVVLPEAGTWKFECRRCKRLLPHRTAHKELLQHVAICETTTKEAANMIPGRAPQLTDPSYISKEMFDIVVRDKFQNNPSDRAVREQAVALIQMFRTSQSHTQILVDIMHAARVSGHVSEEGIAEIGFAMGMQFGFELGLSYPPLRK